MFVRDCVRQRRHIQTAHQLLDLTCAHRHAEQHGGFEHAAAQNRA
jgi:hypothetical protein